MVNTRLRGLTPRWIAFWLSTGYSVCATLYVVVSERLLPYLVTDPARVGEFQTYRALLLVAVSAIAIFELTHRAMGSRESARVRARSGRPEKASSLRTHINVLILAVALPMVSLLGYLIYAQAAKDAQSARQAVQAGAQVAAADASRFIATARQKLQIVAERVGRQPALDSCDPAFDYFAWLNPEFTVLLLWSPQGEVLCPESRRSVRYGDAPRPPWLAQIVADHKPLVSEPYRGPLSGRWITVVGHPVFGPDRGLIGVLDLSIDLGRFAPVAAPVSSGAEVLQILDGKGRIASGRGMDERAGTEDGPISALAVRQRQGHVLSTGRDGIERIYGFAPVTGTDWVAVAGVPVDHVFARTHRDLVRASLLALALLFAVSYGSYRVSLRIERPIIVTARTAQAVADGDTEVRAPVIGPAETRVVARQFNAMLDAREHTEAELARLLEHERDARIEAERARAKLAKLRDGLEHRVALRTRELQDQNRQLESFSYAVSHDLRAPLRAIRSFSDLLQKEFGDQLTDTARDHLRRVVEAGGRMEELIDGLLRLARVSRGDLVLDSTDLSAMAREIIDELRRANPGREVEAVIDHAMTAQADRSLIRNVMENLIGNAWKYSSKRATARIEVGRTATGHGAETYFVRDDGAGFDMNHAGNLFQPFHRLHRTEEFPGTGIGLATVSRIIERHGGAVWAESVEGQGSTFFFTLQPKSTRSP